ncbi:SKI family transcriptional corepressor 1-like [Gigantopelta aegis]|uniref:SKI family transcriptional corepressor 1-like n=1 Tax=Gigantopelta aegis TaxID=1735272 RepID=UPI001B889C4E|nr:SKI family transcriptional corepressor 1-like [Gigantopelta aegis]
MAVVGDRWNKSESDDARLAINYWHQTPLRNQIVIYYPHVFHLLVSAVPDYAAITADWQTDLRVCFVDFIQMFPLLNAVIVSAKCFQSRISISPSLSVVRGDNRGAPTVARFQGYNDSHKTENQSTEHCEATCRDSDSPTSTSSQRSTPPAKPQPQATNGVCHNKVSTVMLAGIPIVCLFIDGKERLCLAQISNTLLKSYSYNEIHNRRVALGITCVQCTPVQLEILRRAGAMPVSSRRCGMITKREADRLVKSFLEDNSPPKLPEDFSFEVFHECGWGGKGFFEPSRYNSSRAKCIKCFYCNIYSSPNKFIFHFHRTPEAKYNHPDAANFNSWRRHLRLLPGQAEREDISFAWEDVKAMFNGGSRKRMLSNACAPSSRMHSSGNDHNIVKKPKTTGDSSYVSKPFSAQYPSYSMFSTPGKPYPFGTIPTAHPYGFGYPHSKDTSGGDNSKALVSPTPWVTQNNLSFPSYDLFWANTLALSRSGGMRSGFYSGMNTKPQNFSDPLQSKASVDPRSHSAGSGSKNKSLERVSAFRPVGVSAHVVADDEGQEEQFDSDTNEGTNPDDENEEIDVMDEMEDEGEEEREGEEKQGLPDVEKETPVDLRAGEACDDVTEKESGNDAEDTKENQSTKDDAETSEKKNDRRESCEDNNEDGNTITANTSSELSMADSGLSDQSDTETDGGDIVSWNRDQLLHHLKKETETRKKLEREVISMKELYKEQSSREKTYKDEMTHQLQVVKDTLTAELEKERKVRFNLQHKLKEAHDALHSFSCNMLASRHCNECAYKETPMPR